MTFATTLAATIDTAPANHLHGLSRDLWRAWSSGHLTDDQAQAVAVRIAERRGVSQPSRTENNERTGFLRPRVALPKRRIPVSPDEAASMARRRRWAASGRLPPSVAEHFSTAEQAVVAVVLSEVKRCGLCGLVIDAIGALAGVSRSTVKRAFRKAASLGILLIRERRRAGQKSLPNIVSCVLQRVRQWLRLPDKSQRTRKNQNTGMRGGPPLNPYPHGLPNGPSPRAG